MFAWPPDLIGQVRAAGCHRPGQDAAAVTRGHRVILGPVGVRDAIRQLCLRDFEGLQDVLTPLIDIFADSAAIIATAVRETGARATLDLHVDNWGEIDEHDGALLMDAPFVDVDSRTTAFLNEARVEFHLVQYLYLVGKDGGEALNAAVTSALLGQADLVTLGVRD